MNNYDIFIRNIAKTINNKNNKLVLSSQNLTDDNPIDDNPIITGKLYQNGKKISYLFDSSSAKYLSNKDSVVYGVKNDTVSLYMAFLFYKNFTQKSLEDFFDAGLGYFIDIDVLNQNALDGPINQGTYYLYIYDLNNINPPIKTNMYFTI